MLSIDLKAVAINFHAAFVTLSRSKTISFDSLCCAIIHRHTWQTDCSTRSTQPCIPPGSLNRVPASAGVRARMSPLPGGR